MIDWVIENFQENRGSFEALESMLLASEYEEVTNLGMVGILPGSDDTAYNYDNEKRIEDEDVWAVPMRKANVFAVKKDDNYTIFQTGLDPFSRGIGFSPDEEVRATDEYKKKLIGTLTYVHTVRPDDDSVVCHQRFEESKCGACVVKIAPNWLAYYAWSAASFTPTEIEINSDIALSHEEIQILSEKAYESCSAEWDELIALDSK